MHIPNILTTLLAFLLLASSAQATYVLAVFQDGECQVILPSTHSHSHFPFPSLPPLPRLQTQSNVPRASSP